MPEPDSNQLPPPPPTQVCLDWATARNIETLLRVAGFYSAADEMRRIIEAAAQAARS